MTQDEIKYIDLFLKESFPGGVVSRELRLSQEELEYAKGIFPKASIEILDNESVDTDHRWYVIRFS